MPSEAREARKGLSGKSLSNFKNELVLPDGSAISVCLKIVKVFSSVGNKFLKTNTEKSLASPQGSEEIEECGS